MRRAGSTLFLVGLLLVLGVATASADCSATLPAKPLVTFNAPPVVYDTSLNRAAIKKHEMVVNGGGHSEADIVLGTTETGIQPSANVQIEAKPDDKGGFCATVVSLKTVIDWKIVVHIASELKPGSCMYNVVLTHENGHVDIANGLMGMAKDLVTSAMVGMAGKTAVAKTPQDAYKILQQAGAAALTRAMTKLNAEMKRRQAAHDTPEEYGKGKQVCGLVEYYHALGR
jgi:hypothetical protein